MNYPWHLRHYRQPDRNRYLQAGRPFFSCSPTSSSRREPSPVSTFCKSAYRTSIGNVEELLVDTALLWQFPWAMSSRSYPVRGCFLDIMPLQPAKLASSRYGLHNRNQQFRIERQNRPPANQQKCIPGNCRQGIAYPSIWTVSWPFRETVHCTHTGV